VAESETENVRIRRAERRHHAVDIFQAGLRAVEPGAAIKHSCHCDGDILTIDGRVYDLRTFSQILLLGAGKAAAPMARAIEELLGKRITTGTIAVKYGHLDTLQRVEIRQAGHPVPDANGQQAAQEIYRLALSADDKTLVICLISGGGSALLPLPVDGVTLTDKQETTRILLSCGATIHEINTIRKHLSLIKGGGLARAVYPATLVTLILSDVVGDDLDTIASGPAVPDSTSFADCKAIFARYMVESLIPPRVMGYIEAGVAGRVPETAKAGEIFFEKIQNVVVASNFNALLAARARADALGYNVLLLSSMIEGETREVANFHMAIAREIEFNGYPLAKPACILSGGETTVTLRGAGKGGRNQEFALAAALNIAGLGAAVVLSAGTDGSDGPTDAAGALVDETTGSRARSVGLDLRKYLEENDSYSFFNRLGDLYKTGPTNTNVMDLRIILIEQSC
jgi:hydroxypyruvate reductase